MNARFCEQSQAFWGRINLSLHYHVINEVHMSTKFNRHDFNIIQGAIDFLDTSGPDVTLTDVAHAVEISPDELIITLKGRASVG